MRTKMKVVALVLAVVFPWTTSGHAAIVDSSIKQTPTCDLDCTWSISVNGKQVAAGMYDADADTGELNGSTKRIALGAGAWAQVNDIFGNIDPVLGFSAAAATGNSPMNFSFSFSLPIALSGILKAQSSVSYTLTSTTSAGAQITPLFGTVVRARDVDSDLGGLPPLEKGVDVGSAFGFSGGPATRNSPVFTGISALTGNSMYDLMRVTVDFNLSPRSFVGLSGFVLQEPADEGVGTVPLPAAAWLLGSGLMLLGAYSRRRL